MSRDQVESQVNRKSQRGDELTDLSHPLTTSRNVSISAQQSALRISRELLVVFNSVVEGDLKMKGPQKGFYPNANPGRYLRYPNPPQS